MFSKFKMNLYEKKMLFYENDYNNMASNNKYISSLEFLRSRLSFIPPFYLIHGPQRHQEWTVRPLNQLNLTHRPQIRPTQTHLKKTVLLQRWGNQILYLINIVKTLFFLKKLTQYGCSNMH